MSITLLLIGFTVLISLMAFNNHEIIVKFKHWPQEEARSGEYYRMLTAGFLHADYMHLIFNMITLYFFGVGVENWFSGAFGSAGKLLFLLFYLMAIVAASLSTYYQYKNRYFASIGASGAVSAVLFAAILTDPAMGVFIYFIPIPIPGFIYAIFYLWYSSREARTGSDNIDHVAHFYGAVFGLLFPLALKPGLLPDFFTKLSAWFASLGS